MRSPNFWLLPLDTHRTPPPRRKKFLYSLTHQSKRDFRSDRKLGRILYHKIGNLHSIAARGAERDKVLIIHEAQNTYPSLPVDTDHKLVIWKS